MIRIFLVEDQPLTSLGIRQVLSEVVDIELVGEFSEVTSMLDAMRHSSVDVLILSLSMPASDGLEVLKRLTLARPNLRVLVLASCDEALYVPRLLRNGATGYISKRSSPQTFLQAIRKVFRGDYYIGEDAAMQLARVMGGKSNDKQPLDSLTDRELQVFTALAEGKRATEIAAKLHISVKTVSTHRRHALEKLQLKSNGDLIRYALQLGVIPQ